MLESAHEEKGGTMPHFPKPAEGSWTEHFGLGTAPVRYDDSITPAFY
jgi:Rieske 2Fe-2S family protein